jgi:hypothetical protein
MSILIGIRTVSAWTGAAVQMNNGNSKRRKNGAAGDHFLCLENVIMGILLPNKMVDKG